MCIILFSVFLGQRVMVTVVALMLMLVLIIIIIDHP